MDEARKYIVKNSSLHDAKGSLPRLFLITNGKKYPSNACFFSGPNEDEKAGVGLSRDSGALVRGVRQGGHSLSRGEEIGTHVNDRERTGFVWQSMDSKAYFSNGFFYLD